MNKSDVGDDPLNHPGVFIIGTDTEVGKTYQACKLARALVHGGLVSRGLENDTTSARGTPGRPLVVGVYKPVASGVDMTADGALSTDAALLQAAAQTKQPLERICPQTFRAAVAPPLAARLEGRVVDESLVHAAAQWWTNACDFLIVEGAGGALSPITDKLSVLDVARNFGLPLILVAANRLGVINHVLLTLEATVARGLTTIGVVLNELPSTEQIDPPRDADARLARQTNSQLLRQFIDAEIELVDSIEQLIPRLSL